MNGLRKALPWLAFLLVGGLAWCLWPGERTSTEETRIPRREKIPRAETEPSTESQPARKRAVDPETVNKLIESSVAKFQNTSGRDESKRILASLREGIRSADPRVAAEAVVRFLQAGADVSTRLPFSVGDEGMMDDVPSLRIALLDLLPCLDPQLALEFSRTVMDQKSNPDEYALALRNLAWNDLNGDLHDELTERLNRMIQMKDWTAKPSAGFLEALDAAVFLSDKQSFESLRSLHQIAEESGDAGLKRASFIALDRVVLRNPQCLVQAFEASPGLPGMPSSLRASLMSRLDITDAKQREIFTSYLSNPSLAEQEVNYFTGVFPNGNYIHGNWLMSGVDETQSIDQRQMSDAKVLAELERMHSVECEKQLLQSIDRIRSRLIRTGKSSTKE